MQKNNLIKRCFLSMAASRDGPFLSGLIWGMLLAGIVLVTVLSRRFPQQDTPVVPGMLMILGAGLALGTINSVVCRRFVCYSEKPALCFLANKDREIILDAEGKVTAGERLWVPRGLKGFRVRLASTTHMCEIDPAPGGTGGSIRKIPLKLRVFFKGEFDPQEVYERIVRDGYRSFNWLVRKKFLAALKATAGLEQTLLQFREHSSMELEEELEKMRPHFSGPDILSNIKKIDVKLMPEATVSFWPPESTA